MYFSNGFINYFISDRPDGKQKFDTDIWMAEKSGKVEEPKNIGEPVNTSGWELVVQSLWMEHFI